eukprot:6200650-Pleurochrysis_carterae.AAC.2
MHGQDAQMSSPIIDVRGCARGARGARGARVRTCACARELSCSLCVPAPSRRTRCGARLCSLNSLESRMPRTAQKQPTGEPSDTQAKRGKAKGFDAAVLRLGAAAVVLAVVLAVAVAVTVAALDSVWVVSAAVVTVSALLTALALEKETDVPASISAPDIAPFATADCVEVVVVVV